MFIVNLEAAVPGSDSWARFDDLSRDIAFTANELRRVYPSCTVAVVLVQEKQENGRTENNALEQLREMFDSDEGVDFSRPVGRIPAARIPVGLLAFTHQPDEELGAVQVTLLVDEGYESVADLVLASTAFAAREVDAMVYVNYLTTDDESVLRMTRVFPSLPRTRHEMEDETTADRWRISDARLDRPEGANIQVLSSLTLMLDDSGQWNNL